MNNQKNLYVVASVACFVAFATSMKFLFDPLFGWAPKHSFKNLPYGTYPIVILGFLAFAKGIEYLNISLKLPDDEYN